MYVHPAGQSDAAVPLAPAKTVTHADRSAVTMPVQMGVSVVGVPVHDGADAPAPRPPGMSAISPPWPSAPPVWDWMMNSEPSADVYVQARTATAATVITASHTVASFRSAPVTAAQAAASSLTEVEAVSTHDAAS